MEVKFDNLNVHVLDATDEEHSWLRELLSFPDNKAHFKGSWADDKIRLYNSYDKKFPTGLLPLVTKNISKKGWEIKLHDNRIKPVALLDKNYDFSWLRDYQLEAVQKGLKASRGIIKITTAGGKGSIAVALMAAMPIKWLFLVSKAQIAKEISERYAKQSGRNEEVGFIGGGNWSTNRITCCTFRTLHEHLNNPECQKLLNEAQGIIIDELHNVAASTYYKVVSKTPNAYYRLGTSATPLNRGDEKNLMVVATTGPIIHTVGADVLIAKGVISKPIIKTYECFQQSNRPKWQGVYGECIVRSKKRNKLVLEMAKRAAKPGFIFVNQIKHGQLLTKLSADAGIKTTFVWGNASLQARLNAIDKLMRGEYDYIICSSVFAEGIDCPELQSVIIASGGKSTIQALQKIGRGMRIAKGKRTFEVWDIYDKGHKWTERHAKSRVKAFTNEGFDVQIYEKRD